MHADNAKYKLAPSVPLPIIHPRWLRPYYQIPSFPTKSHSHSNPAPKKACGGPSPLGPCCMEASRSKIAFLTKPTHRCRNLKFSTRPLLKRELRTSTQVPRSRHRPVITRWRKIGAGVM